MEENFAVERRMKAQKLRRKARRFEVAVRRIFLFIRFLFVLFVFYCIYRMCFVKFWYLPQDTFTKNPPENIEIMGNRIVSTDKILNYSKYVADQATNPLNKIINNVKKGNISVDEALKMLKSIIKHSKI